MAFLNTRAYMRVVAIDLDCSLSLPFSLETPDPLLLDWGCGRRVVYSCPHVPSLIAAYILAVLAKSRQPQGQFHRAGLTDAAAHAALLQRFRDPHNFLFYCVNRELNHKPQHPQHPTNPKFLLFKHHHHQKQKQHQQQQQQDRSAVTGGTAAGSPSSSTRCLTVSPATGDTAATPTTLSPSPSPAFQSPVSSVCPRSSSLYVQQAPPLAAAAGVAAGAAAPEKAAKSPKAAGSNAAPASASASSAGGASGPAAAAAKAGRDRGACPPTEFSRLLECGLLSGSTLDEIVGGALKEAQAIELREGDTGKQNKK